MVVWRCLYMQKIAAAKLFEYFTAWSLVTMWSCDHEISPHIIVTDGEIDLPSGHFLWFHDYLMNVLFDAYKGKFLSISYQYSYPYSFVLESSLCISYIECKMFVGKYEIGGSKRPHCQRNNEIVVSIFPRNRKIPIS